MRGGQRSSALVLTPWRRVHGPSASLRVLHGSAAAVLVMLLCGCGASAVSMAAADFRCSEDSLVTREVGGGMVRITGCGKTALYSCGGGGLDVSLRSPIGPPPVFGPRGPFQYSFNESECVRVREVPASGATVSLVRAPFPAGVAGFTFGRALAASKPVCADAGHWWQPRELHTFRCGGAPTSVGHPAMVDIAFCADQLCRIDVLIRAQDPDGWALLHADVRAKLEAQYGPPTASTATIPPGCNTAMQSCLQNGAAQAASSWRWDTSHSVALTLGRDGDGAVIRIRYETPALATAPSP